MSLSTISKMLPRPNFWSLAVFALIMFASANYSQAQLIYSNNFDQYDGSRKYRESDLNNDWNSPEWSNGVSKGRVKIDSGWQAYGNQGSSLAVKYPTGKYGTKNTGAQWKMDLGDSYEEVLLSYSVKFKRGFDFVKGGKLPGLAGGQSPTGNAPADGFNGWTARMMWRTAHTGNPGSPKQKTSNAISYAKYDQSGSDGDGKDEDETFFSEGGTPAGQLTELKSNRWYEITQRIRMNTPGQFNGVIQIWVDDQLVVDKQDVRFRNVASLGIDQVYFSTFFGGGYSWRTSKYETAYFDNFMVFAVE
ncbi:MAG: polysaccharide lyase [Mariniblastus sp.]